MKITRSWHKQVKTLTEYGKDGIEMRNILMVKYKASR